MIAHQKLIHTFLDVQRNHMELISKHKDQYHEHMHTMAHQSLDSSIKMLEGIHEHVLKDDSDHKSDIMASMIKAAIDSRHHFKNGLTHHKAGANIRKSHMRKLAMGAMAAFGLMSGVKAAGFAPNTSADRTSSTFSEQRAAPSAAGFSRELAAEINAAAGDGGRLFTIAINLSRGGNDALATRVFKMAYDAGDASSADIYG